MTFANCTEAYVAGHANIPKTDPAYAAKLDRDHDGVACENPPAGFKPAPEAQTGTQTGTDTSGKLPVARRIEAGPVVSASGVGAFVAGRVLQVGHRDLQLVPAGDVGMPQGVRADRGRRGQP